MECWKFDCWRRRKKWTTSWKFIGNSYDFYEASKFWTLNINQFLMLLAVRLIEDRAIDQNRCLGISSRFLNFEQFPRTMLLVKFFHFTSSKSFLEAKVFDFKHKIGFTFSITILLFIWFSPLNQLTLN